MEPPPPPRPPLALPDELVEEILVRSPPDDPARLVRAVLVCKRWCRLVSGAGFRRRFIQIHPAPPMLGFLFRTRSRIRFVPTSTFRPRPLHWRFWRPIDARHGRVLLHGIGSKKGEPDLFAVWDPITDDLRDLPTPREYLELRSWTAAVLCAAGGDACNHLDCHRGSFQVVIVGCDHEQTDACIYSSVTGAWRQPASSQLQHYGSSPLQHYGVFLYMETAIAFVCNTLYFVSRTGKYLLEYDLATQEMSVVNLPPAYTAQYGGCITTEDGRLGFATAEYSKLYLWLREAGHDADDGWTEARVIELEKLLPADVSFSISLQVVGFTDGIGILFVDTGGRLFTIDLKSSQVKKVCNVTGIRTSNIFPYMSFFTPALGAASIVEGPRVGSSSA